MPSFDRLFSIFRRAAPPVETPAPKEPPPEDVDARLDRAREPTIWLRRVLEADSLSKLGGLPNLPDGVDWPRQGVSNTPLHFLAQIELAHLPPTPLAPRTAALPARGFLFFFADMEEEMLWGWGDRGADRDATRVIYAETAGPPRAPPADIPLVGHAWGKPDGGYAKELSVFPEAPLQAHVIDCFVGAHLYFQGDASREADRRMLRSIERATGEAAPVLERRYENYEHPAAWVGSARRGGDGEIAPPEARIVRHQMLGAATNVQGTADGARERGLVSLLQLDSDWGLCREFLFCDMGMAQFWITPEDLAAGCFDKAWATTEGG